MCRVGGLKPKVPSERWISAGLCRPKTHASAVPVASSRKPVGTLPKIGFLPNQLMKIRTSTTKATIGVSKDCSIGFIASSSRPSPARQDSRTVRGMVWRIVSPRKEPRTRIIASTKHQTRAICSANSASLVWR